jgi:hypothetical protein
MRMSPRYGAIRALSARFAQSQDSICYSVAISAEVMVMTEYIDPKLYGLEEKEPEAQPEPAVWAAMPASSQNMANAATRVTLLLDAAWLWLRGRFGGGGKSN